MTPPSAVPPPGQPTTDPRLTVGTLNYTPRSLGVVFFWLLWGDFVLTLMDNGVVGNVVQLQLKGYGASNATIGFLGGTVTALMSALGVAAISTASDRHRGPRGRRIPFMLWTTPPLVLCLAAVGFAPQIAAVLERASPGLARAFGSTAAAVLPGVAGLPPATHLILAVLTVTLTAYRVFDLFPQTVYYYLWADVVPARLIGMFACCFRIVAALGMFIFNRFLLGKAATHPEWLYLGAAALYFVSFTAMCLRLKEGQYPPPPSEEIAGLRGGPVARALVYIRESYTNTFYWKFFIMTGAFIIAVKSLNQFAILFGTETVGLSPQRFGELISYKDLITIVPFIVLAPIIDRYHPLRAGLGALFIVLISGVLSFFLIRGETSFAILMTTTYTAIAVYQAATGAINVRILPRERFGQFNSANVIVWQLGWAAAASMCGTFLDAVGDYRYLFLWFASFVAVGLVATILVYRDWVRLGGDEGYVPPLSQPNAAVPVETLADAAP
jgi:hypothetical protein